MMVSWCAASLRSETNALPAGQDPTFSVDYTAMPIRTVVSDVAKLCGIQIIMPKALSGSTSVHLRDVTWRQVFTFVLNPIGYDFIERDTAVELLPIDQVASLPPEKRSVEIYFQRPQEIALFLKKIYGNKITVEEFAEGVTFSTHPRYMQSILRAITQVDSPDVRLDRYPRKIYFPDSIPDLSPPDRPISSGTKEPMLAVTEIVVLHWVDCEAVKQVIERKYPMLTKVTADYRSNAVVITGLPAQNRKAMALAAYLDDKRWYHPPENKLKSPESPIGTDSR